MRILDYLIGSDGSQNGASSVDNLAAAFGITPAEAKSALSAIVPQFASAIERNTLNRGGIADMVAAMETVNPANTLSPDANLNSATVSGRGVDLLQTIFGTKDKSRRVAARVSGETGLNTDLIKKMLPAVATMTVAALAKGSRSAINNAIANVPMLSTAGPLSMPGGGGDIPHQTPLPIPGDHLPDLQSDDDSLPDVIRRGDVRVPNGPNGSGGETSLGNVVRDILGGLLGFQNRGFFGWLLQAIIIPMVLRIIQSVLRRVVTGR